jgi:hypothetical protein
MVQIREPILFAKNTPVPHGGFEGKTPNVVMWISFLCKTPIQLGFGAARVSGITENLVLVCKWRENPAAFIGIGLSSEPVPFLGHQKALDRLCRPSSLSIF